ncbi:hypothetical protein B0G93_11845 [Bacillus sp. V-88]|jgi:hypothetical protein|nr:hypothetical protein B0G93_11845 [Bacillus sp. V-88]SLK24002.1 hypothetical protein SAMN06295884_11845 [Bacillus sp. V-88]
MKFCLNLDDWYNPDFFIIKPVNPRIITPPFLQTSPSNSYLKNKATSNYLEQTQTRKAKLVSLLLLSTKKKPHSYKCTNEVYHHNLF